MTHDEIVEQHEKMLQSAEKLENFAENYGHIVHDRIAEAQRKAIKEMDKAKDDLIKEVNKAL